MRNSVKFSVSIPMKAYHEMEAIRKKSGLSRSAFFLGTFLAWKESRRRDSAIRSYISGYRDAPEDPALAEDLAQAAAEVLSKEDWT